MLHLVAMSAKQSILATVSQMPVMKWIWLPSTKSYLPFFRYIVKQSSVGWGCRIRQMHRSFSNAQSWTIRKRGILKAGKCNCCTRLRLHLYTSKIKYYLIRQSAHHSFTFITIETLWEHGFPWCSLSLSISLCPCHATLTADLPNYI